MLKEGRVEVGVLLFEDVEPGFHLRPRVPLGEDAHTHLVEAGGAEGSQSLFFQGFRLVIPRVAGGAERVVGSAIGIAEMPGITHPNRAMVAG